jgi:hypothetical protein
LIEVDHTAPTLALVASPSGSPTLATSIDVSATFAESVTGFSASDVTLSGTSEGWTVGPVTGSGTTYAFTVQAQSSSTDGMLEIGVPAGGASDAAGNTNVAANALQLAIDWTAPTSTLTPPQLSSNATTLSYAVTFSESVTGLTSSAFSVAGTAKGCELGTLEGSGASYTVDVTGCSEGTVQLELAAEAVVDAVGHPGPEPGVVASSVSIDRTSPTAHLTAPATPSGAATLTYTVVFGEPVLDFDAADLSLAGSAAGCTAAIPAGSGASYTVAITGCSDGILGLTLQSGSVVDAAGNTGPVEAVAVGDVTVDSTGPAATLACTPGAGPTTATDFLCTVTFSEEPATGSSFSADDVLIGGTSPGWIPDSPTGSAAGPYSFTVATGGADGILRIAVGAGAVEDAAGNGTTASETLVWTVDHAAPSSPASLAAIPRTGSTLSGSSIPLTLTWKASTDAGSGLAASPYEVARSVNGGSWLPVGNYAGTSTSVAAASSGTVRYRVRAVDRAGNKGAWTSGSTLSLHLTQQSSSAVRYSSTWSSASSRSYSGGSVRYARTAGRAVSYTFTGRSIGFVTAKSASRGKVKVYVNGVYQTTVDTYRSSSQYRAIVWQKTWSTSATRTIKLVVCGTSGRPRVDLDAFAVVK